MRIGLIPFLFLLPGCATYYVFLPVEVTTERVSPVYRLTLINQLETVVSVVPTSVSNDMGEIAIPPGESHAVVTVLVKQLRVGGNRVNQITEGPYIEVQGAGVARMSLRTLVDRPPRKSCDLQLDLRSDSWFDATEPVRSAEPPVLLVCVAECIVNREIFGNGPQSRECADGSLSIL